MIESAPDGKPAKLRCYTPLKFYRWLINCLRVGGETDPCQKWLRTDNFAATPGESLSSKAAAWIRERLDSCSRVCHPMAETKFLPSRLVRVDCDPPRLVETRHLARADGLEKYAALSYCWGKPDEAKMQLKTEKTTIHVMLEGIPEPEMTRVLKEAIQATRALGIPFLWIDALCIVQGDKGDWEKESKMMGKIYNEAYCTLCAISSKSCLEGFLQLRPALLSIPFRSNLDPSITGEYSLRFRGLVSSQARSLEDIRYSAIYEDFTASNWAQRGWTYQEYALSKRLVVFSHNAVHFICPDGSQTFGHNADQEEDGVDYFQVDHLEADMTADEAYNEWCNVAADFSRRLLTYPGDRFPAISGLARYFGDILEDEYLAGLWKSDLWRGLYWGVGVNVAASWAALLEQLSRPNVYKAPSWSWASRDRMASFGEACYDRGVFPYGSSNNAEDFRCECKSIEGRATYDGAERYLTGEVEGGSLLVTTRMCPLPGPIEISDDLIDTWIGPSRAPLVNCAVDWLATHDPSEQWKYMSLVLLGSAQGLGKWSASDRAAYGLVVYPVLDTVDTYFRVGIFFSLPSNGGGLPLFDRCREGPITLL